MKIFSAMLPARKALVTESTAVGARWWPAAESKDLAAIKAGRAINQLKSKPN